MYVGNYESYMTGIFYYTSLENMIRFQTRIEVATWNIQN